MGVDFGVRTLAEPAVELPEEPREPEDAEASRDAFRTLLNLKEGTSTEDRIEQTGTTTDHDVQLTSLQRKIYEFNDSGMRVSDIARELGVGKGEVKLILNMRKSQA